MLGNELVGVICHRLARPQAGEAAGWRGRRLARPQAGEAAGWRGRRLARPQAGEAAGLHIEKVVVGIDMLLAIAFDTFIRSRDFVKWLPLFVVVDYACYVCNGMHVCGCNVVILQGCRSC